ncbi:MAG: hypothetical protein ACOVSW_16205 [Candidatus Kapaibacteriota bacterium]
MNTKYLFITLSVVILTFLPTNSFSQVDSSKKRIVYWIHGVNGDNIPTWDLYDNSLSGTRQMYGLKPKYPSDRGVDSIANLVQGIIDTLQPILRIDTTITLSSPIAIAGSLGGLVARSIEQQSRLQNRPQPFSGIITINSPHRGAEFFAAIKNGGSQKLHASVFDNAVNPLGSAFVSLAPFMRMSAPIPIGDAVAPTDTAIAVLSNIVGNVMNNYLYKRYNESIFDDMTPQSPFLNRLNVAGQVNDTIPVISITGSSPFPSVYRLIYSTLHGAYNDPLDQHQDDKLAKSVETIASIYRSVGYFCLTLASNPAMQAFQTPQTISTVVENIPIATAFFRGAKAIEKDYPNGVSVLIGSAVPEYRVLGQKTVRELPSEDDIPSFRFVTGGRVITRRIQTDDGALSKTEQTHPNRPAEDAIEVTNVNHNGAINNQGVRRQLDNTFERDRRFRIRRKQ